jgi:YggT family protein
VSISSCQAALVLQKVLNVYIILLTVYALTSWIPSIRGRWTEYLARFIEPALLPIRRVIPPIAGLDLAFIILFIGVQWLGGAIVNFSCSMYIG